MTSSCSPKGKAIQSRVRKQNNCHTFGDESTSSGIPTASFVFIYTSEGLRTADCRMRYKTRTKHWVENTGSGVKLLTKNSLLTEFLVSYFFFIYYYFFSDRSQLDLRQTLSYALALRSFHLFLLLLGEDQFDAYLRVRRQNPVPIFFVSFITYQSYQNSNGHSNPRDYYQFE